MIPRHKREQLFPVHRECVQVDAVVSQVKAHHRMGATARLAAREHFEESERTTNDDDVCAQ
jgi:hypothetical protein